MGAGPLLCFVAVSSHERKFILKDILEKIIAPIVSDMSLELYDLEFVKEGGIRILRLFIDSEMGVSLNDCEMVSYAVEAALDQADPIPDAYRLQVGSPGVERKLTKPAHYKKSVGKKVRIKLFAPIKISETQNQKTFAGILAEYTDGIICIKTINDDKLCFSNTQVASCRLFVFDDPGKQTNNKRRSRKNG